MYFPLPKKISPQMSATKYPLIVSSYKIKIGYFFYLFFHNITTFNIRFIYDTYDWPAVSLYKVQRNKKKIASQCLQAAHRKSLCREYRRKLFNIVILSKSFNIERKSKVSLYSESGLYLWIEDKKKKKSFLFFPFFFFMSWFAWSI